MKIVKESLFEKFIEDSDPITDMDIGMRHQISKWMKEIDEEDTDENALMQSAEYGKLDFVKYLLSKGTNVHTKNDYALRIACQNGYTEIVKTLLDTGADVHALNNESLRIAVKRGYGSIIRNKKIGV